MLPVVSFPAVQAAPTGLIAPLAPVNPSPEMAAQNLLFRAVPSNVSPVAVQNNAPGGSATSKAKEEATEEAATQAPAETAPFALAFPKPPLLDVQTAFQAQQYGQSDDYPPFSMQAVESMLMVEGASSYRASQSRNLLQLNATPPLMRLA